MYAVINLPGSQHFAYYGPDTRANCQQWLADRVKMLSRTEQPTALLPQRVVPNNEAQRWRYRDGTRVIREVDIVTQINLELDRLGWSSDTAPEGETCLDAFPTEDTGVVALEDTQETTLFDGAGLLSTLTALPAEIEWEDLWQAILPYATQP